ncbi:MAG: VCBS repeat-containing protein [Myxococcales bacterium]|nr:VCBS repeat-containing protein [Myxococcales bacterium]
MSYGIPIDVPAGFEGVTPSLSLQYSSTAPNGMVGMGWDLPVPFIERMTNWGLPEYTAEDQWVANGGEQLSLVAPGVYRARFEGGFARYTWVNGADGTAGHWVVELPNGVKQYFGADETGAQVETSRVETRGGTFRYHLVAVQDQFGHLARYRYEFLGGLPHLARIDYTFTAGEAASSVTFDYEAREDALSDARSGVNEVRTQRLAAVNVFAGDTRLWQYQLAYEAYAVSGGQSRLARVVRVGRDNSPHPVELDFEYSQTLGARCEADCGQPALVEMGNIGASLGSGDATFIDINGDGLADLVDTSLDGAHRFFINEYAGPLNHGFSAAQPSAPGRGTRASHQLSSPYVQVLDANGDGRTDMVNVQTGQILLNLGDGDWAAPDAVNTAALPDFADGFAVGAEELAHIRFLDYDNDRRIDVIQSRLQDTTIYRNLGLGGFEVAPGVESIGAGFADSRLEFADMNGDGLLDPVTIAAGQLTYRINLGFGQWSAERVIGNLPFNEAQIDFVELEDINGDSLDDLVMVIGTELRYALNRGGDHFDAIATVDEAGGQALPDRSALGTNVFFADMNGSGSDDVVWVTAEGNVTYLELFPVKPNLLTRITNGLGMVVDVEYVTATQQMAADAEPWAYTLPFPMLMVESIDTYDLFHDVHRRATYTYHDAWYDTEEKQLRGFGRVEVLQEGDDFQQAMLQVQTFDLGIEDRHYNGRLLTSEDYAIIDGELSPLKIDSAEYGECDLAGVPAEGALRPRFICLQGQTEVLYEGGDEGDAVTTRVEYDYDGYGNQTLTAEHGVVALGGGACPNADRPADLFGAPSGADCIGDERYTWSDFVSPENTGGRWILNQAWRVRSGANADGSGAAETLTYFDGEPFVGLPQGSLTLGLPTRVMTKTADGAYVASSRQRFDANGNPVEQLGADGEVGQPGHRLRQTYDAEGLLIVRSERELVDEVGTYSLVRDFTYEPAWGLVASASDQYVVRGGDAVTTPQITRYTYDALGRVASIALPGDPADRPSTTYSYEMGSPNSRIVTRVRSQQGSATPDRTSVQCLDGFERVYQTRTATGEGDTVIVSGFNRYNRGGQAVERARPYQATGLDCDQAAPAGEKNTLYSDAYGRTLRTVSDDAALFGSASVFAYEYGPLWEALYSQNDTDAEHPHYNTPTIRHRDGLGRVVAIEFVHTAGQAGHVYRMHYDATGSLTAFVDPMGNTKTQITDLAGRVLSTTDGDRGTVTYAYNNRGQQVRREDGAGRVTETAYDGMGRRVASWDPTDRAASEVRFVYDDPRHCGAACDFTGGRLIRAEYPQFDGVGSDESRYDARGQIAGQTRTVQGVAFTTTLEYDNAGGATAVTLPDGTRFAYTQDAAGRIVAVPGLVDAIDYTAEGQIAALRFANGVAETYTYDQTRQLIQQVVTANGGTAIDRQLTRDRMGNLVRVIDGAAVEGQASYDAVFDYDALNHLVSASLDQGRGDLEEVITLAFDPAHNMTRKTSSKGGLSPAHLGELTHGNGAGPHAVTRAGDLAVSYDAAGHMVRRGDLSLTWDHQGRLVGTQRDEGVAARMSYDAADGRVAFEQGAHFNYLIGGGFEIEDGMALAHLSLGAGRIVTVESAALAAQVLSDVGPADGQDTLTPAPDGVINTGDALVAWRVAGGEALAEGEASPVDRLLMASARRLLLEGEAQTTFKTYNRRGDLLLVTDATRPGLVKAMRQYGAQNWKGLAYPLTRSVFVRQNGAWRVLD